MGQFMCVADLSEEYLGSGARASAREEHWSAGKANLRDMHRRSKAISLAELLVIVCALDPCYLGSDAFYFIISSCTDSCLAVDAALVPSSAESCLV